LGNLQKEFVGDRLALFSPTVETVNDSSTFLTDHPRRLLKEGRVANPVPWVVGVNSEEGLIYAASKSLPLSLFLLIGK